MCEKPILQETKQWSVNIWSLREKTCGTWSGQTWVLPNVKNRFVMVSLPKRRQFFVFSKAWFSLATQAQAQAQVIGMTLMIMKFDANTSTSKIIRTFRNGVFRREVIWIQCFHWPNISTCGKYPCACGMPERYFVFTCCSANTSLSASTRKRKIFYPCACAYACVEAVFTVKWELLRLCLRR